MKKAGYYMENGKNVMKILHIVSSMDRGGAETLIMNIYRNIDRSKIQFDFVTHSRKKGEFDDEIIALGGKIHRISSLGELGPINYIKELKKTMLSENYAAIHSHTDYQSGFPALAARICGIKERICHSHSNNWQKGNRIKEWLILQILKLIIRYSATSYCSCSNEAAEFLFSKTMIETGKVKILKNGIDINDFLGIEYCRENILKELSIPKGVKIIGHVGRFSKSKNHLFILKVLQNILQNDSNYIAVLIGDGPLKEEIELEAERMGIIKNIRFLGVRDDIPKMMKIFDVLLFPSIFEGFGIVTLEAQCAGTPCVVSDAVPRTTDMGLGLISYMSLNKNLNDWSEVIKKAIMLKRPNDKKIRESFLKRGFSIEENVHKWLDMYFKAGL